MYISFGVTAQDRPDCLGKVQEVSTFQLGLLVHSSRAVN